MKAHKEKRNFIERLLSTGEDGPLSLLTMNRDGMPYLRMNRASHLVGMVGLNEMVQIHSGEEMHESKKALKFGLKIIAHLKLLADRMKRQENMRLVLEQTPAESTSYRFAKLDLHYFSPASGKAVKGDVSSGEVYYTNSTHLNVSAPMNPIERVTNEGLFHPLDRGRVHFPRLDGESMPSKGAIADFVTKTFRYTSSDQIAFSPEFTICNAVQPDIAGAGRRVPSLPLRGGGRHHQDYRLFYQGVELEQRQAGRAERPLPQQRVLLGRAGKKGCLMGRVRGDTPLASTSEGCPSRFIVKERKGWEW